MSKEKEKKPKNTTTKSDKTSWMTDIIEYTKKVIQEKLRHA